MKEMYLITVLLSMVLVSLTGCAQQPKSTNSQQAIEQSKAMKTPEEQAKYLVSEARAFVNSQKFDQAIQTAQYVLANLDANSQEAKSIVEKATEEMKKMAQAKIDEMKKSIGTLGK